jgi:UDP-N-acetylmuramoylalanine--D-glutamate ligase
VILIAGGKSKGGDLHGFLARIAPRLKHLALIGSTAPVMGAICDRIGLAHADFRTLEDAVRGAADLAEPGDQILLSPGFASFDMFRNYEERGERFERAVHELEGVRV